MKRERDDEDRNGVPKRVKGEDAKASPDGEEKGRTMFDAGLVSADYNSDDGDDDKPVQASFRMSSKVKKGSECPYLDTISRQNLDFDFEKCCSVSLSPVNVYVCLICGKYFQGRGPSTHAYTHSLETNHHMFMKLENGKVYCLPEMYEVVDRSLDDIRFVLNPLFESTTGLDATIRWARALDGTEYMPGLVGLNNLKHTDYINVIIQSVARITPIRDYFLLPSNYRSCGSVLVQRFGELMRKIWNPRNFKGQVSPHEFMQAVMTSSKKRFSIDVQSDPVDLYSWLLNTLHLDLTGGKRKKASVITQCLQGELEIITEAGTGKAKASKEDVVERVPFLLLGLDLPPPPLFKDALEKNIIPQVPIFDILKKFDGQTIQDDVRLGRQRYRLTRLPRYLTLHMKRFRRNNFFVEKNPTIVNFPVKNLDLAQIVPVPAGAAGSKFDLVSNIVHEGKAGAGTYRCQVHRKVEDIWYEVQDLMVSEVLPQMVALSEAYMQVYQLKELPKQEAGQDV